MITDENRRHYEKRAIGARYASRSQLEPDEAAILSRFKSDVANGPLLDLGVGGGRTTAALVELNPEYLGVDYSAEMVNRCRQRFPDVSFAVGDARRLSALPDAGFGFVLFSFNGIDAVGQADRLSILREVHRVLKPEGLFVFSSHNRNFRTPRPWDLRHLAISPLRHPVKFCKRALTYPIGIINYLRHATRHQVKDEFSIHADAGHMYSVVNYHITVAAQVEQLDRMDFSEIEAFANDGDRLSRVERETTQDPWIYYACRKTA